MRVRLNMLSRSLILKEGDKELPESFGADDDEDDGNGSNAQLQRSVLLLEAPCSVIHSMSNFTHLHRT